MRGLDESGESLVLLSYNAGGRIRHAWQGFVDFAMRENVLEVAIGLMIGQAFTKVVTSFVSDVILPVISLLPFLHRNLDEKFAVLKQGPHYDRGYNTLAQARSDGALVMAYGTFLNNVISFLGVGLVLYGMAHFYVLISHDGSMIKRMVKCKYCKKWINRKADRCVNCSSWQDGREEVQMSNADDSLADDHFAST
ncbi:Large-conductance mechanosensitive channel [Talaromyces islandicus]|uniref:Large-conductance mechanosensitive channel n=1 Tax=Talaromyces islandicus TaxID=28573 RepID=A0A0U1LJ75_TALIS|nr:Large-conductance mechanosensitive channel [Talaromyces islandicus]